MGKYELLTEVDGAKPAEGGRPSRSPVYVATAFKDAPKPEESELTLYHTFVTAVEKFTDRLCLGARPIDGNGEAGDFEYWTYTQTADKVVKVASAMKAAGIQRGSKIGIYGVNCREWMVSMQACNRMSFICIPLYDTLGDDAIEYIINHAEVCAVFLDGKKMPQLETALPKTKGHVKNVVYWGKADEASVDKIKGMKINVQDFDGFMESGGGKETKPDPPKPEDLCTIMYTSGTTGVPKGVMLTHRAVSLNISALKHYMDQTGSWGEDDCCLSYLPLAHIFDRMFEELAISLGIKIGYWQGEITKLVDDIGALKPTFMIGVPRVFDRIYAAVMNGVKDANFIKRGLFRWGYSRKNHALQNGIHHEKASPVFDKLVFSKVKQRLGGRVRILLTGGAPIAPHTWEFLKVCSCAAVCQGYGLTETCAGIFITVPDNPQMDGTTGPPLAYVEFCLESVPDMNYDATAEQASGEICVRAPYNFSGYYKAKDMTSDVLEADGWFHTGDIGTITSQGALKIIDRKKNILKLSQGEYVAVEKIEGVYKQLTEVEQIWVHGDSLKNFLVAVVVPSEGFVKKWAAEHGKSYDYVALCKDQELITAVQKIMDNQGKEKRLKGFEFVKKIALDNEQFSPTNDLLTPTFKLKRPQLKEKYKDVVEAFYAS